MSNKYRTGWVYVLTNESIPDKVKVGFTSGHPEDRAKKLKGTHLPTPFNVATAFLFVDKAHQIEQKAHRLLKDFHVTEGAGVEWFQCSAIDAADAIQRVSEQLNQPPVEISPVILTPEVIAERERLEAEQKRADAKQEMLIGESRRREAEELKRAEGMQRYHDKCKQRAELKEKQKRKEEEKRKQAQIDKEVEASYKKWQLRFWIMVGILFLGLFTKSIIDSSRPDKTKNYVAPQQGVDSPLRRLEVDRRIRDIQEDKKRHEVIRNIQGIMEMEKQKRELQELKPL